MVVCVMRHCRCHAKGRKVHAETDLKKLSLQSCDSQRLLGAGRSAGSLSGGGNGADETGSEPVLMGRSFLCFASSLVKTRQPRTE